MRGLEAEIAEWRSFVGRDVSTDEGDIDELEDHLRSQVSELMAAGLAEDEAFLIAVKRIGAVDELSREFAQEHTGRLWRQLVVADEQRASDGGWLIALLLAVGAAVSVELALLASGYPQEFAPGWVWRNAGLLVIPFLAAYFVLRRRLTPGQAVATAVPFLIAAVVVNLYPIEDGSSSELLIALHLPVLLWFLCSYPYMGGELRSSDKRMDFVRFTGEWLIYYALIALGGGVLVGLTALVLEPAGVDVEQVIEWVLPAGAAGAVLVAAWLVESKQRIVENMAPVLTMIFTPLFALMLIVALVVYAFSGLGEGFDRELLGVFDALLVVVLGLVLYAISARDSSAPPGWMDRIQLVAVGAALLLDLVVLGAMVARIVDVGLTPNRAAALGLNLVLLVNLLVSAWLSARFIAGKSPFRRLENWQTGYLPVFVIWAATVVIVFPPLFAFS